MAILECLFYRAILILTVTALGHAKTAQAQDQLRLMTDIGGHTSLIRSVIFTPNGKELVSAGDDKVIRVWDIAKGKTTRTLRGYIGQGDEGKIYAMALSPDGTTLAVAGRIGPYSADGVKRDQPAHWIRLHNFATGTVKSIFKGHEDVVNSLAFSADGNRLVSASSDQTAIIWDVQASAEKKRLKGHVGPVLRIAYVNDTQIATAGVDRSVRFWNASDGSFLWKMEQHKDRVTALAVSPTGAVASGAADGAIVVYDPKAGSPFRRITKLKNEIGSLTYSLDGQKLIVGPGAGGSFDISILDGTSGRAQTELKGHDEIVLATAVSPDGKLVAGAGGQTNAILIWDASSNQIVKKLGGTAKRIWAAGFSNDGTEIAWGTTFRKDVRFGRGDYEYRLRLSLNGKMLGEPGLLASGEASYTRGQGDTGGWSLTTAPGGASGFGDAVLEIRRNGEVEARIVRENDDGYRHTSYTFTPEGDAVISGGAGGTLASYDLSGNKLGDYIGHEGEVWALTPSRDGRFLISGGSDGTVRLWNLKTRELLVSLLNGSENEWVLWTPQGYYASSPGGDALVGWQVNRGYEAQAEFYTAAQLRQHFYRPDVVAKAIELASATEAIHLSPGTTFTLDTLLQRKPPQLLLLDPSDDIQSETPVTTLKIKLVSPSDPVKSLLVYVNDREVSIPATRGFTSLDIEEDVRDVQVNLAPGLNSVKIVARNAVGDSFVERLLTYKGPVTSPKGKLFIVAIGVNSYDKLGNKAALQYSAADAKAFTDSLKQGASELYADIKTVMLAAGSSQGLPTRANIEDAIALFKEAGPNDTSVLFLAGHGVNEGRDYLFLPQDAETQQGKWRASSVIPWITLQHALQSTQGRRLMFVDTCHAGNAYNARLAKDAVDTKIVVFSATDANTLAHEKDELKHGVFTWAVVTGMKGGADFADDGTITVLSLGSFVSSRVQKATQGLQKPAFYIAGSTDFTISKR